MFFLCSNRIPRLLFPQRACQAANTGRGKGAYKAHPLLPLPSTRLRRTFPLHVLHPRLCSVSFLILSIFPGLSFLRASPIQDCTPYSMLSQIRVIRHSTRAEALLCKTFYSAATRHAQISGATPATPPVTYNSYQLGTEGGGIHSLEYRHASQLLPHPPLAKSNYQNRIVRHKMESQFLTNLANYKPTFFSNQKKFSVWHKVPVTRRSAVMVLLFLGDQGELRVILTKRSRQLKSFSGHISLPGGKADNGLESEFQCARREMDEEIGISRHNNYLQSNFGFVLDELKTLPAYLARTFLAVTPCVGYINWHENVEQTERRLRNLVLNPGESASVFSVPLRDFLQPQSERYQLKECLKQSHIKTKWAGLPWNLRSFVFPLYNKDEVNWLQEIEDLSSASEDETHEDQEFDVRTRNCWGLTANILHDVAEIVYRGTDAVIGEEDLMWSLLNHGQMQTKGRTDFEKRLINNTKGSLFGEVIPQTEITRLREIYQKSS